MSGEKPNFIQQLMQRRVMRAMSLYLVSAFVILQVADITFEPLGLPNWVMQALIAVLVAGLPATAVLAWIFDLTRSGIVRTGSDAAAQAPAFTTARKVEFALIVMLAFGLAWFMYFQVDDGINAPPANINRSVAVLPFSNLGAEDHLAHGLTNELTSALSSIPDLHVASYSFAAISNLATDTAIAAALNVDHLVKGSVQQAQNQLRVTAQVIRARDGRVLWSERQDQSLDNIFAIQDVIATNVAANLQSTLYREALASSIARRTDNLEAYQAYLKGLHNRPSNWRMVVEQMQLAVRLDPEFVPAITLLAQAYLTRVGGSIPFDEAYPLATKHANLAIQLDPDYPSALIVQAHLQRMARQYDEAEALLRRAKQLAPGRPSQDLANFLRLRGKLDEAIEEYERSLNIDPLNLNFYGTALFAKGRIEEGFELVEAMTESGGIRQRSIAVASMASWHAFYGNNAEGNKWADAALRYVSRTDSVYMQGLTAYALHRLGREQEAKRIVDLLERMNTGAYVSPTGLFWAYFGVRDLDRAFIALNRAVDENALLLLLELKTSPLLAELRDDLRYINVLERLGLHYKQE